jgi:hypothetical protein
LLEAAIPGFPAFRVAEQRVMGEPVPMHRIVTAIVAALSALFLLAPPALAGNGTNNFYLKGSCHVGAGPGGVDFWLTNYDSGSDQTYHTGWKRSGVAWIVDGIYVDNVYKGKGADLFIKIGGHGAHRVKIVIHVLGSVNEPQACPVTV